MPYINASTVPGIRPSSLPYIATQHPLPCTVRHFWRMVLLLQPAAIVMLNGEEAFANLSEFPKYWEQSLLPSDDPTVLETLHEEHDTAADSTVRSLRCTLHGLTWCGVQFVSDWWRDQTEPPLEKFCGLVRLLQNYVTSGTRKPRPVLVHCAGGIGRTGVFIAAESGARAAALGDDRVDCAPDRIIEHLRKCRMNMVQSADQYMFLHHVLPYLTTQLKASLPWASSDGRLLRLNSSPW